jgi:hypothetical protein
MLVVGLVAPVAWFWIGSSHLVPKVRGMEARAIGVIEHLDVPQLEPRDGPTRMGDREIRVAWALSLIGSPELLRMAFQDDPYWQPGRGVWVSVTYRSNLDMRRTGLRLAKEIGEPATRCPDTDGHKAWEEYWLPIEGEGAEGGVTIYLRRLRDEDGVLEQEFSVVAEFDVKACGTLRDPGTGSCP